MAKYSRIEWTDATWSPVTGCTPVSEGCQNCYAKRMANRLRGRCGYPADEPFKVTLHKDRLEEPLRLKKPRRVFVCSMGDLFHEDVPRWMMFEVMDIILQAKQHTFLILTKRPANMKEFFEWYYSKSGRTIETIKNLWLGVTAENQQRADERIPILLQIPAAVLFVSIEPMLGPVDLASTGALGCTCPPLEGDDGQIEERCSGQCVFYKNAVDKMKRINWVICGGETGPGARPMRLNWVRSLRDQCQTAGISFFFKAWGEYGPNWLNDDNGKIEGSEWMDRMGKKATGRLLDGRTWDEMPEI